MSDTQLRWGVLGTAKIACAEVAPAIRNTPRCRLLAASSREQDAAEAFAVQIGAERAYGAYEALLADDDIDAVYVPLPNSMHAEWAIAALESGRHVLCEKPMAMTAAEAKAMAAAARRANRVLVEGFMYRFHPRIQRLCALLDEHVIGDVRLVRATYTIDLAAATDVRRGSVQDDIRLNPDLGGGALSDLGSYCVNALRTYANARVAAVQSWRDQRADCGVETVVAGQVQFANDIVGQFCAALNVPGGGSVEILGTGGRIRMANAFRIRGHQGQVGLEIETPVRVATEWFPFVNQYELEIAHFAAQVLDGAAPIVSLEDSLESAATLEAIRASWQSGAAVAVAALPQDAAGVPATTAGRG